jgi:hypothetical protein
MEKTYLAEFRGDKKSYPRGPFAQSNAEQIGLWKKFMEAQHRWELDREDTTLMMEFDDALTAYRNSIQPLVEASSQTFSFSSIFKLAMEQHLAKKGARIGGFS